MTTKLETNNLRKIKVDVKSSIIDFMEYSNSDYSLDIKFKGGKHKGKLRSYDDISPEDFFNVLNADSVGKAVIKLLESRKSN